MHHAHAAPAAARRRFDDHRVTHFAGRFDDRIGVIGQRTGGARHRGDAGFSHRVLGRHLVAHQANRFRARADKDEARLLDLFGKVGVFGQKAVARVNTVGVGDLGGRDNRRGVQVAFGGACRPDADRLVGQAHVHQIGVGLGVHGDGLNVQGLAGAQNAQRDLAAIGDEDFVQHVGAARRQTMENSGWSNSTGSPFSTSTASIVPGASASI